MSDFKAISGMSYILLRRKTINTALLPRKKITSTDFKALIQLALSKRILGPTSPYTPPEQPHGGGDFVSKNTVGVYKTMGHLQQQMDKNFSQPIQNFTNAARDIQRFTRDVQGITRNATKVWQDAKGAWDTTKQTWNTIKNLKNTLSDLFSGKKKDTNAKKRLEDLLVTNDNRNYFDRVRIPWTVTTVERRLKSLGDTENNDNSPIQFFVNPSKVRYSLTYTESLELVQKGHFLTSWTSSDGNNRFPALKVTFTFQSSNILAERYANSTFTKSSNEKGKDTFNIESTTFSTPPGVRNFYDLIGILNAPRIVDATILDLDDDQTNRYDGQANYVILKIATRLFPLLTLEGFFQGSLDFSEDAQDPLKFESELNFIAFKSDPPWWDNKLIQKRYEDFYQQQIASGGVGASQSMSSISILDGELSKFAQVSNIPMDTLAPACNANDDYLGNIALRNLDGVLETEFIQDAPPPPPENFTPPKAIDTSDAPAPPPLNAPPAPPIF